MHTIISIIINSPSLIYLFMYICNILFIRLFSFRFRPRWCFLISLSRVRSVHSPVLRGWVWIRHWWMQWFRLLLLCIRFCCPYFPMSKYRWWVCSFLPVLCCLWRRLWGGCCFWLGVVFFFPYVDAALFSNTFYIEFH